MKRESLSEICKQFGVMLPTFSLSLALSVSNVEKFENERFNENNGGLLKQ
jgi:hypothetical protein